MEACQVCRIVARALCSLFVVEVCRALKLMLCVSCTPECCLMHVTLEGGGGIIHECFEKKS